MKHGKDFALCGAGFGIWRTMPPAAGCAWGIHWGAQRRRPWGGGRRVRM